LPKHIPQDIRKEGRDEEKCENDAPPEKNQSHSPHFSNLEKNSNSNLEESQVTMSSSKLSITDLKFGV
jgi:hypothetical protein